MTGRVAILLGLLITPSVTRAIDFWVGEGSQEATLSIDWDDAEGVGPSLMWGYRWDGEVTAEAMLRDIVTADPRLFVRLGPLGVSDTSGTALYGFGYDRNGDGQFSLNDSSSFDMSGISEVDSPADLGMPVDPSDLYIEGWFLTGFWNNVFASESDPDWSQELTGFSSRPLADGDRQGWVFARYDGRTLPELDATRPEIVTAAPVPHLPGDFNADGFVDAADYTVWRDMAGATTAVAGAGADADLSSTINAADLAVWKTNYGTTDTAATAAIPEPAAAGLLITICLLCTTPLKRTP